LLVAHEPEHAVQNLIDVADGFKIGCYINEHVVRSRKGVQTEKYIFEQFKFLKVVVKKYFGPRTKSQKQIFVWTTSQQQQIFFCFSFMSLHQIAHIDEILDRIFVHLNTRRLVRNIQLVCKQWFKVADEHVDYSYQKNWPIRWACKKGYLELVDRLL
jgi:hypothetical protein